MRQGGLMVQLAGMWDVTMAWCGNQWAHTITLAQSFNKTTPVHTCHLCLWLLRVSYSSHEQPGAGEDTTTVQLSSAPYHRMYPGLGLPYQTATWPAVCCAANTGYSVLDIHCNVIQHVITQRCHDFTMFVIEQDFGDLFLAGFKFISGYRKQKFSHGLVPHP